MLQDTSFPAPRMSSSSCHPRLPHPPHTTSSTYCLPSLSLSRLPSSFLLLIFHRPSPSPLPSLSVLPPSPPSLSPSAREHQPPSVWPCHLLGHPLHRPQDVGEAHAHGHAAGGARSEEGARGPGTRGHRRTGEGRGGGGGRRETIHWPEKQRFHAET